MQCAQLAATWIEPLIRFILSDWMYKKNHTSVYKLFNELNEYYAELSGNTQFKHMTGLGMIVESQKRVKVLTFLALKSFRSSGSYFASITF